MKAKSLVIGLLLGNAEAVKVAKFLNPLHYDMQ
jgi:hypothetical protein